jgi:hypothetical protein
MDARMKPKPIIEKTDVDTLKLTDEEINQVLSTQTLSKSDLDNLKDTIFELSILLFHLNESSYD